LPGCRCKFHRPARQNLSELPLTTHHQPAPAAKNSGNSTRSRVFPQPAKRPVPGSSNSRPVSGRGRVQPPGQNCGMAAFCSTIPGTSRSVSGHDPAFDSPTECPTRANTHWNACRTRPCQHPPALRYHPPTLAGRCVALPRAGSVEPIRRRHCGRHTVCRSNRSTIVRRAACRSPAYRS
jgi:hypothetical protein